MADLVTTATIRAHDALTGPLNAMAARVAAINSQFARGATHMRNAAGGLGLGMGAGALGFGMLLERAEKFNEAIFGVGIGSVVEAVSASGQIDLTKPLGDMETIASASMNMSQRLRMSATTIAQIGETLAKAGMDSSQLIDTMEAVATLSKTDMATPAARMAEYMNTLRIIMRPRDGEDYRTFMRRQAGMVLAAASETQLSVGTIMDGMRMFQTIGAGMGLETEEMLALLMGGARRGFGASELGTALRSDLVRTLRPTAEGNAALNQLLGSIGRDLSMYSTAAAQDPTRAVGNLRRAVIGGLSPQLARQIQTILQRAQRDGTGATEGVVGQVANLIARSQGINDLQGRQRLLNTVRGSITTPSGNFQFIQLLNDLVKAGATDAQIASIFEGRQLARNKAFMDMFRPGEGGRASEYEQTLQLLRRMNGQGMDVVETLWSRSAFGNMNAMKAAFDRLTIRFANAPAIQEFVNGLERLASTLERGTPEVIKFGAAAAVFGVLAGPALNAGKALYYLGGALVMVASPLGRLAAMPFTAIAAGISMIGGSFGMASLGAGAGGAAVIGRVATSIAGIAAGLGTIAALGGIAALVLNFDKVAAMPEWAGLQAALGGLGTTVEGLARDMLKLFQIETTDSPLLAGLGKLVDLMASIVRGVDQALKGMRALLTPMAPTDFSPNLDDMRLQPPRSVVRQDLARDPVVPGVTVDYLSGAAGDLQGSAGQLTGSADGLSSAAQLLQDAAAAMQSAASAVNGAAQRGRAVAPANPSTNGQGYGGR